MESTRIRRYKNENYSLGLDFVRCTRYFLRFWGLSTFVTCSFSNLRCAKFILLRFVLSCRLLCPHIWSAVRTYNVSIRTHHISDDNTSITMHYVQVLTSHHVQVLTSHQYLKYHNLYTRWVQTVQPVCSSVGHSNPQASEDLTSKFSTKKTQSVAFLTNEATRQASAWCGQLGRNWLSILLVKDDCLLKRRVPVCFLR